MKPTAREDRQAEDLYATYRQALHDAGLPPSLRFTEFASHMRAQGAMSLLTHMNARNPDRLSFDPDAVLIDELAERLALGDAVIRRRTPKENP